MSDPSGSCNTSTPAAPGHASAASQESDHALGVALARCRRHLNSADARSLKAALNDLLAGNTALAQPLRHLIELPTFSQLDPRDSRSVLLGRRDALLQELGALYLPGVVARVGAVLDGYLGFQRPQPLSREAWQDHSSYESSRQASAIIQERPSPDGESSHDHGQSGHQIPTGSIGSRPALCTDMRTETNASHHQACKENPATTGHSLETAADKDKALIGTSQNAPRQQHKLTAMIKAARRNKNLTTILKMSLIMSAGFILYRGTTNKPVDTQIQCEAGSSPPNCYVIRLERSGFFHW